MGTRRITLGVSGRLRNRNLVMWDAETNSLWSQLTGEAIHGQQKGEKLALVPAVFAGMKTWRRLHPTTLVLDLPEAEHRAWHFTTEQLGLGVKDGEKIGIGLRADDETLLVPFEILHDKTLVAAKIGGRPVAVVWLAGEKCAFVYSRRLGKQTLDLELRESLLVDVVTGQAFDPLSGEARGGHGAGTLERIAYLPTTVAAWKTHYPRGAVVR